MALDNRFLHETAEGIELHIAPAGIGVRSVAFLIDLLIRGVIIFVASMIVSFLGDFGMGLFLLVLFLVEWFYPVLFEVFTGTTPGKKQYGLVVVYDNGLPITLPGSLIRNLFRAIDILPFGYALAAVTMLNNDKFKRLGDILAGTMVIFQDKSKPLSTNSTFDNPIAITSTFSLEQKMSIIEFAERSNTLSDARKQELATLLAPTLECKSEEAVEQLQAIGANLMGKT